MAIHILGRKLLNCFHVSSTRSRRHHRLLLFFPEHHAAISSRDLRTKPLYVDLSLLNMDLIYLR